MVIDNFNMIGVSLIPDETDSPLIIYTDAVASLSVAPERFKMIRRRDAQIIQRSGIIDHPQLHPCLSLYISGQFP